MPAPQIRLTSPPADDVRAWLIAQPDAPPPYPASGATRNAPTDGRPPPGVPAGWNVDHRRVHIGDGEAVYAAAHAALLTFAPLDIGWVWPVTTTPKPEPTTRGAMIVRAFGMVWVNAWRIVYVDDDVATADGGRRTAFAYGTMEAHAERGEERFMVEMLPDGSVWYDILAFSHPHHALARLGGPVTRWVQRRFGPASVGRMREVVDSITVGSADAGHGPPIASSNLYIPRTAPAFDPRRVIPGLVFMGALIAGIFPLLWVTDLIVRTAAGLDSRNSVDVARLLYDSDFVVAIMMMCALFLSLVGALPLALHQLLGPADDPARVEKALVTLPIVGLLSLAAGGYAVELNAGVGIWGLLRLVHVGIVAWFTKAAIRPRTGTRSASTPDLVLRSAFVLWLIGTLWLAIDGLELAPLGFPQPIVRLTAVHFHFAGFIVPVIAATLARAYPSRLANTAAVVALLGVPSTAIGITATQLGAPHVVEAMLALPMIAGALLVAAVHLCLAFGPHGLVAPMRVVALRAVVGVTLIATMALALVYALRGWLPWSPTIPQMALWHGIGNAFGVATCGLVACWLDPATQPPVG
ncbi:MAG: YndJ family transporter [Ardenticatenales bacterium]|nr:YndJ family transporter [Ardenticatenales bacterium]